MVDNQDFLSDIFLDKLFAVLIPHRAVHVIVKLGDDSDGNEVEHDGYGIQGRDDDADVAKLSCCGDKEMHVRNHKCKIGSLEYVVMVEHKFHIHQ